LRKPSNTGSRFGVCAIIHFTVSLGLWRRASVFGQRTNDGFALPGPACFGTIGERPLFSALRSSTRQRVFGLADAAIMR
jgi:hypothetical protein